MKWMLRMIGFVGTSVFAAFLYFTFSLPAYIEQIGQSFIQEQIRIQTDQKIDSLLPENNALVGIASKLLQKNQQDLQQVKQQLKSNMHEKMATAIAELRDLDCECRKKYQEMFQSSFKLKLGLLETAQEKLMDFMRHKYMEVATELKRDVRLFISVNLLVFLLLLLISFLKPIAIKHLFLPGVLLMVSTFICSYFYIFQQNWLMTIIYSNYWGFAYLAYVGFVFSFLCDIVFNRARITTEIINAILEAIGSADFLSPC